MIRSIIANIYVISKRNHIKNAFHANETATNSWYFFLSFCLSIFSLCAGKYALRCISTDDPKINCNIRQPPCNMNQFTFANKPYTKFTINTFGHACTVQCIAFMTHTTPCLQIRDRIDRFFKRQRWSPFIRQNENSGFSHVGFLLGAFPNKNKAKVWPLASIEHL